MNSIINKALQSSVYANVSEHAQNIGFTLKWLPKIFKPNDVDTLDFLELRYRVEWPVNIVITENCVLKYNKVFSFMLRIKRIAWALQDIWFHLKHVEHNHRQA